MAALYPIRLPPPPGSVKTASHRNQVPFSKSLAGGSSYNDRALVPKEEMCSIFYFQGGQMPGNALKPGTDKNSHN